MSSPNTPNPPENPEPPEVNLAANRIRHIRNMIIGVVGILAIGVAAKMCGGQKTHPYELPDIEKAASDKINAHILKKGGKTVNNVNAVSKGVRDKEGKVVLWELRGYRYNPVLGGNDEDGYFIKHEKQEPQLIPINEECLGEFGALTEFHRCAIRTGIDPRITYGVRSQAFQDILRSVMKAKNPRANVRGIDGPHTTGHCVIDIGRDDAVTNKTPYAIGEDGRALFVEDVEDPEEKAILEGKKERFEIGAHDVLMECGLEAGFIGGFCGKGPTPKNRKTEPDSVHYEHKDSLSKNNYFRQPCERGDARWTFVYEAHKKNKSKTIYEYIPGTAIKIWDGAKGLGNKGIEGAKKGAKWVGDTIGGWLNNEDE